MPWKESRIVNERVKFVADVLRGERTYRATREELTASA